MHLQSTDFRFYILCRDLFSLCVHGNIESTLKKDKYINTLTVRGTLRINDEKRIKNLAPNVISHSKVD